MLAAMNLGHFKSYIVYIFVAIFFCLKVADVHALTHSDDDDIEHCEVCTIFLLNNFTPIINDVAHNYIGNNHKLYFKQEITSYYSFVYSITINNTKLFSRPPPFLV